MRYFLSSIMMISFLLSGCATVGQSVKPMSFVFKQMPDPAPPTYKEGWKDGCESGLTVKTNDFYKTFYRLKQNPQLIHDVYYYHAWKSSFDYCRAYAYGMLKEADLLSPLPADGIGIHKPVGVLQLLENMGPGTSARW